MFYLVTQVRGENIATLVDSGASTNFISAAVAQRLHHRLYRLAVGQSFQAATGEQVPCTHFVRVNNMIRTQPMGVTRTLSLVALELLLGITLPVFLVLI